MSRCLTASPASAVAVSNVRHSSLIEVVFKSNLSRAHLDNHRAEGSVEASVYFENSLRGDRCPFVRFISVCFLCPVFLSLNINYVGIYNISVNLLFQ